MVWRSTFRDSEEVSPEILPTAAATRQGCLAAAPSKTQEEYEVILRDRGLLGAAATPEQERRGYLAQAPSGFLLPEPVGTPEMVAAVEDLKHEMVANKLAMAQLKTCIEDFNKLGFGDMVEKARENKYAIAQLKTDIEDFKGKLGVGDKFQKVAKTDSLARWAKAIIKWLFVANAVVLLFCIVFVAKS